jgi:thioredoxin reductase
MTEVKYEEITEQGLTIKTKEGKRETLEADTIVTALPLLPNTELLKGIERSVSEVYTIGDCKEPRMIVDSIAEGSRIGRTI